MSLVTGASGTIGSATVAALKARGAVFKAAVRSLDKAKALGAEGGLFDWSKPETFGPALAGVESVLVVQPTSNTQIEEVRSLAAAAKAAGVKRVVRLSVVGADSEPGILLGRQHRDAEAALNAAGLAHTLLRPTFFMQNFGEFYGVSVANGARCTCPTPTARWPGSTRATSARSRNGWAAATATGAQDVLGRAPRSFAQYAADLASGRA